MHSPISLWAHTVVYALFQHYDTILLTYYFLVDFVDFFWYHFNITMVIMIPEKVQKAYYKMIFKQYIVKQETLATGNFSDRKP